MGAPDAVVSKYQQTKAGAIGRRGLSAMMGGPKTVVVIDAAAWVDGYGSRGWDMSSNVSVGAVVVAQMGGVGHKGLQSRWHDIR